MENVEPFEIDCITKENKQLTVEIMPSVVHYKDQLLCILAIRDVTRRKVFEKKQHEYQEIFLKVAQQCPRCHYINK